MSGQGWCDGDEFSRFSYNPEYVGEGGNPEMPMGTDNTGPNKIPLFLARWSGKEKIMI